MATLKTTLILKNKWYKIAGPGKSGKVWIPKTAEGVIYFDHSGIEDGLDAIDPGSALDLSIDKSFIAPENNTFIEYTSDTPVDQLYALCTGEDDVTILSSSVKGSPAGRNDIRLDPVVIAKFNEVSNSTMVATLAVVGSYTLEVDDATGASTGSYIIIFNPTLNKFSTFEAVSVSTNTLTLDAQMDIAYPVGSFVDIAITDMSVNGSVTPRVFGLRGIGTPTGIQSTFVLTRIIFSCITASPVTLLKFADIAKLTRGLLLRTRNGIFSNIFNVKDNSEIAGIMFDFEVSQAINPQQGIDGFVSRLTFSGESKIGAGLELPLGEDVEIIVQDSLLAITKLEVIAEGISLID